MNSFIIKQVYQLISISFIKQVKNLKGIHITILMQLGFRALELKVNIIVTVWARRQKKCVHKKVWKL